MVLKRLWPLIWVGIALLAALPVMAAAAGPGPTPGSPTAAGSSTAAGSPIAAGSSIAAPTPTVDRLAAPPTVTNPNQADVGEQLFWLHCQPCHGDRAQGLTDDWRAQYPPDHQDCWKSRCHGSEPYRNGFTLPHTVPALIGPGTLNRFATAAELFAFVSHAMPFQAPGSLKPEEYWAITAFLMRGHGLSDASLPITDAASAQRIPLGAPVAATAAPATPPAVPSWLPASALGSLAVLAIAALSWLAWRRSGRHG